MNKTLIALFFYLSIVYPQQMLNSEGTIFGTLNNNTETRIIKEYYDNLNLFLTGVPFL